MIKLLSEVLLIAYNILKDTSCSIYDSYNLWKPYNYDKYITIKLNEKMFIYKLFVTLLIKTEKYIYGTNFKYHTFWPSSHFKMISKTSNVFCIGINHNLDLNKKHIATIYKVYLIINMTKPRGCISVIYTSYPPFSF